jgi:ABC-type siderophore export system fused ATPase/permease subunit
MNNSILEIPRRLRRGNLSEKSLSKAFIIYTACAVSGIFECVVILLIIRVVEMASFSLYHLLSLPVTAVIFLASSYLYHKKGTWLAEEIMTDKIIALCDNVRLSKLADIEKIDKSEIYNKIWEARNVTDYITTNLVVLHNFFLIISVWIYAFLSSLLLGLLLTCYFFLIFIFYEVFRKILKSEEIKGGKITEALFKALDNILYGFKEVKLNGSKKKIY